MNKPKIIFLDGFEQRAGNMLDAFEGLCDRYTLDIDKGQKTIEPIDTNRKNNNDAPFLIFLVHGNDHKSANSTNYKIRIWYGGDGGGNIPIRGENDYRIKRRIVSRDFLTSNEAQELIQFAQGKNKRPSFLLSNENRQGIHLAGDIYNSLLPFGESNDLTQYDKEVEEYSYLIKPFKKLRESITTYKNQKEEIPFLDPKYIKILFQFRDEINNLDENL